MTPPLPQATSDPGAVPAGLAIPTERPWFLFTFDFLSIAERKNPYGLVDAFVRAFAGWAATDRPVLVIKTINADRHPGPAERLRLQVAEHHDVVLVETYLDHHERHLLVANCTAYVSLHRSEGLGLTVAEAMAWGKPVITTAYGGVMQFCNDDNALLVDWEPRAVGPGAEPYDQASTWAEPDLDHAARLMRLVVNDPERAAQIGQRAAHDVRELHNPQVAGALMRKALDEGRAVWETARAERQARRSEERGAGRTDGPAGPLDPRPTRARRLVRAAARRLRR